MIKVKKTLFRPAYNFYCDEAFFGALRASFFFPKALFIAREGRYKFLREKWLEGKFFCEMNYDYKIIAEKPIGMRFSYLVKYQANTYLLKPGVLFDADATFRFELYKDNELQGSMYENPRRFSFNIEMSEEIKPILQVFVFWLGYRAWVGHRGWRYAHLAYLGS